MAEIEKIRVMVSSRSLTKVFASGQKLSAVRLGLQQYLHSVRWTVDGVPAGRSEPIFDVWIHETETGVSAGRTTFQLSIEEIDRADVVLILYNGDAGSVRAGSNLGICHAELQAAVSRRPEVVFMVRLMPLNDRPNSAGEAFRAYVSGLSLFQKDVSNEQELCVVVAEMLQNVVARLARRGSSVGSRKLDHGEALQWNRMNLSDRRDVMRMVLANALGTEALPTGASGHPLFSMQVADERVLVRLDAIPAAASEPAARELVGQPFLRDHLHASALENRGLIGPIHVVACHRTITESQAAKMLGTPDSMIVASDFGIFAADHIQKIQIVLLARCSDESATAVVVRRFREWLQQSGEGKSVIERARSRRRILAAVALEQVRVREASQRSRRKPT